MAMPFENGGRIIEQAIAADQDERIWQMWLCRLITMTQNTFKSFSDFRDQLTGANVDQRPAEEIIAEAQEIEKRLKNGS